MATTHEELIANPRGSDNGPKIMTAVWSLFAICAILVGLRMYASARRLRWLWWDDHLMIASWISFLVALIQLTVNVHLGFGKPSTEIEPQHIYRLKLGRLISDMFLMIAPALGRISFILTLSRIFDRKLKWALWCIAVSTNLLQAATVILQWAICDLKQDTLSSTPECWSSKMMLGVFMGAMAYTGLVDLILTIIPWILMKNMRLDMREMLGIASAMAFGFIAAIAAFTKCAKLKYIDSGDYNLEGGTITVWAAAEASAIMIATCIPILRVFIKGPDSHECASGRYLRSRSEDEPRLVKSKIGTVRVTVTAREKIFPQGGERGGSTADEASDRGILHDGMIMKTREVMVNFDERRASDFELNYMTGGTLSLQISRSADEVTERRGAY